MIKKFDRSGDMLRAAVQSGSELGKKVEGIMARGDLVEDETMLAIIREVLIKGLPEGCPGFILDGFPRTVAQAQGLHGLLEEIGNPLAAVFYLECPEDDLVQRICGRRIHPKSGRTYHVTNKPPKVADKDDLTGEPLVQRPDDNEESLRTRLHTFNDNTKPLIEYYNKQGLLLQLDSTQHPCMLQADIRCLFQLADDSRIN